MISALKSIEILQGINVTTSLQAFHWIEFVYIVQCVLTCVKMMLITRWLDKRLQWLTYTGIKNWDFDSFLLYPLGKVWVPRFRLANCQSNKCGINSNESNLLTLYSHGVVSLESELTLSSSCDLDFICT